MDCRIVTDRLGEYFDAELSAADRQEIQQHVLHCAACREEYESLGRAVAAIKSRPPVSVPPDLWPAIRRCLDDHESPLADAPTVLAGPAETGRIPARTPWLRRLGVHRPWNVLAAAASLLILVGLGAYMMRGEARAAAIDFRPILEQADGDIAAGIRALIQAHGGRPIALAEAQKIMTVRIHPPQTLPEQMSLQGMYLLRMGTRHRSLAFHFSGPGGHLLMLQCPAGVRKDYGNQECLPCKLGADRDHALRVGSLRLLHRDSPNVCVCIVSTLDEARALPAVLDAIAVDY